MAGGDPFASGGIFGSSFSTLRLVPASFDCDDGERDALTSTEADFGGVDRADSTSGVPERLPAASSFLSRAAKLLVDDTASA